MYISGYHLQLQMLPFLWWWRKPVVFHVHDYYPNTRFHVLLFRILDKSVTRYVVVSDAIRSRLESLGISPSKIEKIFNGIDLSKFDLSKPSEDIFRKRYGWPPTTNLVAFVGQIAEHKGPLDLVRAGKMLFDQKRDVKMLIVGDASSDYSEKLRQSIHDLGLEDMVVFSGFENDASSLFTSIDILVVPSRNEDPAPLVAVEGMAAAKPVVVTNSGGLAELVENGKQGFVVEKQDVKGIVDALMKLLDEPTTALNMGEAGRTRVERVFSIQKQAALLEDCLLRVSGTINSSHVLEVERANA
jgi:glycosyltransferase involved in cell wall biosynthesis